jgi:RNA polymerase sigma factor (sigma-70 family)
MTEDIVALIQRCHEENKRFHSGRDGPTGACRELFRLAIVEQSQWAWKAVYEEYHAQMLRWASGSQSAADDIVQGAWEKFFNSVRPERFPDFVRVGALLSFLKSCVKSVLIDRARVREREQTTLKAWNELEGLAHQESSSPPSGIIDDIVNQQFAEDVYSRLRDDEERLVIVMSFELGLKPREIAERYAERFPTAKRVSRIKERVIRRLAYDPVLRQRYGA